MNSAYGSRIPHSHAPVYLQTGITVIMVDYIFCVGKEDNLFRLIFIVYIIFINVYQMINLLSPVCFQFHVIQHPTIGIFLYYMTKCHLSPCTAGLHRLGCNWTKVLARDRPPVFSTGNFNSGWVKNS